MVSSNAMRLIYPGNTTYDSLARAFHTMSDAGFDHHHRLKGRQATMSIPVSENNTPSIMLLDMASSFVDPQCIFEYDKKNQCVTIGFSDMFSKPPVHQMWHRIDAFKTQIDRALTLAPNEDHYIFTPTRDMPDKTLIFMTLFGVDEGHLPIPLYRLPENKTFVDSHHFTHRGLVTADVMNEYLGNPPSVQGVSGVKPCAVMLHADVVKRVMQELKLDQQPGQMLS